MDQELRHRIRYRLSQLQSDSDERLFERICAEIARIRIHANIQIAGSIAGHGDKGRDFENIPGQDAGLLGPRGCEDHLKPDDSIVGACTLGRSDPCGKVRDDIRTIHANGPKPHAIYYFCEADDGFPTAHQTDLRNWCQNSYGTALHVITGSTLAEWLCADDLRTGLDLLGVCVAPGLGFRLVGIDGPNPSGTQLGSPAALYAGAGDSALGTARIAFATLPSESVIERRYDQS